MDRRSLEQFEEDDEEEDDFDEDDGDQSYEEENSQEEDEEDEDEDEDYSNEEEENEEEVNGHQEVDNDQSEDQTVNFLSIDTEKQISKAKSVKNQLLVYDNLLETRIKFQRLLHTINQLPTNQHSSIIHKSKSPLLNECLKTSKNVLKKIYKTMLEIDSHIQLSEEVGGKRKDLDLPPGGHPKRFCSLREQYPQVLDAWFERTKFIHANHKQFSAFEVCPTKSISNILQNKERLLNRTKVKRSEYDIVGETDGSVNCNEIYDDDDFYHILLKDIVENDADNLQDPTTTSRKYIEIQRLRNKIKKKVDTKASKGRKIRYNVQEKLVNFMAPIDMSSMPDEARNELFKSLFGGSSLS